MGKINATKLIETMLSADCYVLASHVENSPNALCEAMLLGMPCIATQSGGVGSFITHRSNGLLVQSGDSYSIAASIIEISRNKTQAVEFGRAAREISIQRHDPQKIVNSLLGIYQEIINPK
jgi:glycosyltransferase involved in cell wall biosynthesis